MGIKRNGTIESGYFDSQYSVSIRKEFTLNPNIVSNSNFSLTFTSTAGLGTGIYASSWGGYNGGISNPTENYHACIDNSKFGYNVYMFNESNGVRCWKGITNSVTGKLGTGNHIISLDAFQNISGAKLFGGFYYTKSGSSSNSFASGQFSIPTSKIPVNQWGRVSAIIPFNNDVISGGSITLYIYGYGFSTNAILYIKNIKVEVGEVPTPWCFNSGDSSYIGIDNKSYSSCFTATDFMEI